MPLTTLIPHLASATPTGGGLGAWTFVALLLDIGLGVPAGAAAMFFVGSQRVRRAKTEAAAIKDQAQAEARTEAEKIRLEAERKSLERKEKAEAEFETAREELRATERRLAKREDMVDRREETTTRKESSLEDQAAALADRESKLTEREATLAELIEQQTAKLHQVTGLSKEAARDELLHRVEERERPLIAKRVRELNTEADEKAAERAREITLQAIQRFAAETTSESTVRTVAIPSDDMKGRIIGREGRNIRAIEKSTGADIIVENTPGVIVVSCFDKVRQAVAVRSLERLIADGRMHPTRIEEIVEKTKSEVEKEVAKAGKDAAEEVNLRKFNPKVLEAMGKLHFRTSYGQNVLRHSIEVAFMSQVIADLLGFDGRLARRCGFLHDIGKAMDHEMEGGHPKIGMEFAKQYGETEEAVLNAIGGHHGDIPATTFYTPIVMAADAVSSARPGARRESLERYVQRLNELQDIALAQPGVIEAHAIQAGREVRVMIDADSVSDDEAYLIAHDIAKRVSDEMTFPGEIKVTVLRETRAIEIAR